MNNLTDVQSTSTSLPFDFPADRGVIGSVVPRAALSGGECDRMYELLAAYFDCTSRDRFDADLAEKESVVLLRDRQGEIQGFSTFLRMTVEIDGRPLVAFFSGDTIVDQQYWGETTLSRLWSRTVFAEAARIQAVQPGTRAWWFLICSGYKTFRFLPVFFRDFYPNPAEPAPAEIRRILDTLGERKFGPLYDAASGIVRFTVPTPLRRGVAEITEQRLRDPLVAFFDRMNPGHSRGDELACLTEIATSNLTRAGQRMVGIR